MDFNKLIKKSGAVVASSIISMKLAFSAVDFENLGKSKDLIDSGKEELTDYFELAVWLFFIGSAIGFLYQGAVFQWGEEGARAAAKKKMLGSLMVLALMSFMLGYINFF